MNVHTRDNSQLLSSKTHCRDCAVEVVAVVSRLLMQHRQVQASVRAKRAIELDESSVRLLQSDVHVPRMVAVLVSICKYQKIAPVPVASLHAST